VTYNTQTTVYIPGRRSWKTLWLVRGPARKVVCYSTHNEHGSIVLTYLRMEVD